jgi:hypothetical protein
MPSKEELLTAYRPETAPRPSPSSVNATAPEGRSGDNRKAPVTKMPESQIPAGVRLPDGSEPGCLTGLLVSVIGRR